jgi:glycosyl transferase, family 25
LRKIVSSLPQEAGLVILGNLIMNGLADRETGPDLARVFYFNGTFAYLITPSACRALINFLAPPRWHIDHQISDVLFQQRQTFKAFRPVPQFFEPD